MELDVDVVELVLVDVVVVDELDVVVVVVVLVVVGQPTQHGISSSRAIVGAGTMLAEARMLGGPIRWSRLFTEVACSEPPIVIVLPVRRWMPARGASPMPRASRSAPNGTVTSQPSTEMMPP